VRVVLDEVPQPHQPVQRPRRLVAMAGPELRHPQGQVAVAAQPLVEDLDVARAIHGLDGVVPILAPGGEHVLPELVPVAGALPEGAVDHLRRPDLGVAVLPDHVPDVLLHQAVNGPSPVVPEHHSGRLFLLVEEVQLLGELAVVALLGLLQTMEVGVQVLLAPPGGPVDALQHLVARVAPPVGTRQLHQLEGPQLSRGGHVRTAAEIHELALAVEREGLVGRDGGDDLGLVLLALVEEEAHRVVPRHLDPLDRQVAAGDFLHSRLDHLEVLGAEALLPGEVVVEPVLDHGADGHLGLGKQLLHRVRHQVRGGVADDVHALGVTLGDDRQRGVPVDAMGRVHEPAVDPASDRCPGQSGADRGSDLPHRHRLVERLLGTIGQGDDWHVRHSLRQGRVEGRYPVAASLSGKNDEGVSLLQPTPCFLVGASGIPSAVCWPQSTEHASRLATIHPPPSRKGYVTPSSGFMTTGIVSRHLPASAPACLRR